MKFTPKMSGIRVDDFNIDPIFEDQLIYLDNITEIVHRQETMDWILDKLRFTKSSTNRFIAIIDYDTNLKLSILENYPEYEKELIEHIGDNWINHYIRFNH